MASDCEYVDLSCWPVRFALTSDTGHNTITLRGSTYRRVGEPLLLWLEETLTKQLAVEYELRPEELHKLGVSILKFYVVEQRVTGIPNLLISEDCYETDTGRSTDGGDQGQRSESSSASSEGHEEEKGEEATEPGRNLEGSAQDSHEAPEAGNLGDQSQGLLWRGSHERPRE